tara:strand:- start:385 stop:1104 length:720 start_codon:yes stop_codon:yes gene_type:complete
MKKKEYEKNAINLLRTSDSAILSTISKSKDEYPFGSFVTFVTGKDRTIFFYFSDIAEHTKNLKNNSKACLTISSTKKTGDKQDSSRLTLIGDINKVELNDIELCKERFYTHFPESKEYAKFHSFNFYQLNVLHSRWIGGFGKIGWLKSQNWHTCKTEWNDKNIINHMNEDHQNTIVSSLKGRFDIMDTTAKMILLTTDGYYLKSNKGIFFIQFTNFCNTSEDLRKELISLAKEYKNYEI